MRFPMLCLAACLPASAALAESGGELNPPELGMDRVMENIRNGQADMMTCASGYYITKKGEHALARELFEVCAEQGWTGAMTWM